ncbi:MAG: autotransporter-associated beta strand repeat-containing protein, partial [Betaproteobacteria bacterium]|nr:autotransporter-associated beta strand repeat-containing protein [Betaproteobacteria bacterium]
MKLTTTKRAIPVAFALAFMASPAMAEITISTTVPGPYNGNADTSSSSGNILTITSGGDVTSDGARGGNATGADDANDNTLNVNGTGNVTGWVFGGRAEGSGDANDNEVNISGNATVTGGVYGGYSASGAATGNTVTISGGTVESTVYGGSAGGGGDATGNTVNINGGTLNGAVSGGFAYGGGDRFTDNTLNMNSATTSIISASNFEFVNFTYSGNANIDSLVVDTVGAMAGSSIVKLNTNANDIVFSGNITESNWETGGIEKLGTGTLTLTSYNNYLGSTTVTEGTLAGNIASDTDLTVASGATYDGSGTDRYVNALSGAGSIVNTHRLGVRSGTFSGVISGAGELITGSAGMLLTLSGANTYTGTTWVFNGGTLAIGTTGGDWNISNHLSLVNGATLHAGNLTDMASGDLATLDVYGYAYWEGGALNMEGQTMRFFVPTIVSGGDWMLYLDDADAYIDRATVMVGIDGESSRLEIGDEIALIWTEGSQIYGTPANTTHNGTGMQGVTLRYAFDIFVDAAQEALVARLASIP